jgi:uncharacterized membrane protein YccF (DUF307 family)
MSQPPLPPTSHATSPVSVAESKSGPGLLVRALWFVFVGWWLTGIVSTIAWLAMLTILGLPLGIWLINRIPTVLTLRPRTSHVYAWTDAQGYGQTTRVAIDQPPWLVRGLWFILVGWWASGVMMTIGYLLVLLIITLPLGLMVFNRVPFVASLYRY